MALFKRGQDKADDDMVSLADEDHAWWADRDELERVFVAKKRTASGTEAASSGGSDSGTNIGTQTFAESHSTESLFSWAASDEPDDPTFGGNGLPLDPYRVLGLQPGASLSEVVAAHRALAKRYHPDQYFSAPQPEQVDAVQKMSTVNAAYQELRTRLMGTSRSH